jgi:hypothetical protein
MIVVVWCLFRLVFVEVDVIHLKLCEWGILNRKKASCLIELRRREREQDGRRKKVSGVDEGDIRWNNNSLASSGPWAPKPSIVGWPFSSTAFVAMQKVDGCARGRPASCRNYSSPAVAQASNHRPGFVGEPCQCCVGGGGGG